METPTCVAMSVNLTRLILKDIPLSGNVGRIKFYFQTPDGFHTFGQLKWKCQYLTQGLLYSGKQILSRMAGAY
jgi:hypothetical protein